MLAYAKEAIRLLSDPGKITVGLRWRLLLYFFLFIGVILSVMIFSLIAMDIFSPRKAADTLFEQRAKQNKHYLEKYFSDTADQWIHFVRTL